jgi:DNA-binding response OmpR family regulator
VAWTPTQARILDVLADGRPHSRQELRHVLWDEEGDRRTVRVHLCAIRKTLRPVGEDVICELHNGTICYRRIRLATFA